MSALAKNHWVSYRSEEEIANTAEAARRLLGYDQNRQLDIIECLRRLEGTEFKQSGKLSIEIFEGLRNGRFAYVTFKPLVVHLEKETWDHASWGDPISRFVVAHELGHAALHNETAKAFSSNDVKLNMHGFEEHSAEWQADTFALHLLMPDFMVLAAENEDSLARSANVEVSRALLRLKSLRTHRQKKQKRACYVGDSCPDCNNVLLNSNVFQISCSCGYKGILAS